MTGGPAGGNFAEAGMAFVGGSAPWLTSAKAAASDLGSDGAELHPSSPKMGGSVEGTPTDVNRLSSCAAAKSAPVYEVLLFGGEYFGSNARLPLAGAPAGTDAGGSFGGGLFNGGAAGRPPARVIPPLVVPTSAEGPPARVIPPLGPSPHLQRRPPKRLRLLLLPLRP